jgi:hypothetical protein
MIGKNQIRRATQEIKAKQVRDKFDATYMKGTGRKLQPGDITNIKHYPKLPGLPMSSKLAERMIGWFKGFVEGNK